MKLNKKDREFKYKDFLTFNIESNNKKHLVVIKNSIKKFARQIFTKYKYDQENI